MAASKSLLFLSLTFSLFIFTLSLSSPPSPSSELDILLSFRSAIVDPNLSLSSWSNTSLTHHCNWTGISCTSSFSVTSLNLQSLNLSGEISATICELPNLSSLNLADNQFNQPIPLHLSECTSLETLNLSNNLIWGTIPDQISQFTSLKVLDFSRNHLEGKIPDGFGDLKGLQVLNLGSNLLSGTVPVVFGNFSELLVLDLSENLFLVSEIPGEIGKLDKLEQLLLHSSGFYGEIPSPFVGLQKLKILDLSQNNLTGEIPKELGISLGNLVIFDVSANKISGSFPDGICSGGKITSLSLHTNSFTGSVPQSVNKCLNLERFQVQNNGFSADFPKGLWSLPKIKLIRAENNRFSGEIPGSISNASELEQVQIDNNTFTGEVPQGLGMVKSLYRFSASNNRLFGKLPPNFCDSPVMSIVNLSHNLMTGDIPEVKKCRRLVSLSLADNNFVGEIPSSLGELPVLTYLDLSNNNLTGSIPIELQNLKLALFNVSFNDLFGTVPPSLISGLPASYLQGNSRLCGPGLPNPCSSDRPRHKSIELTKLACILIFVAVSSTIAFASFAIFVFFRHYKQKTEMGTWRSVFFYPLRISDQDLIMSIHEKTAVGIAGTFGRLHIVSLPSGELVAVKKLANPGKTQSCKALKGEIKTIAKIRHKNIVKILGFCCTEDSIFLVYEYLPKGSLGDIIGRSNCHLEWRIRLKIAIGIAQGLAYLHKDYTPRILHRNLKSRNVLLDANFEPKLTDIALDRLVGDAAFQSTFSFEASSSCFVAPEHRYNKKATEEMDVYSFGVVLLELLTGRQAESADIDESLDVVKWVRRKINIADGALQVLDPTIPRSAREEMLGALEIALHCTSVMPEKRPVMAEVVRALQSVGSKSCLRVMEFASADEGSVPV